MCFMGFEFKFKLSRAMQAVDNREARLRKAFSRIEMSDGRIRKEDLIKLLTVNILNNI